MVLLRSGGRGRRFKSSHPDHLRTQRLAARNAAQSHAVELRHTPCPLSMRSARRVSLHGFILAIVTALAFVQARPALSDENDIDVRASKAGDTIVVDVDLAVRASQNEVWSVLTDYDHMAQYVANLDESAVISRNGNT